jgi:ABC-type lipoprotein release transport system permease subunit
MSTLTRKSWGDLKRHRARTVLTVCTLGLALASLGIASVPGLMDSAMQQQVQAARLYDVAVTTHDLVLDSSQFHALGRLPNIAAVDAQVEYSTRVSVGDHQQDAVVWGTNLANQPVDRVTLTSGRLPGPGELLSDQGNAAEADLVAVPGDEVGVRNTRGTETSLRITGMSHSLATSPSSAGGSNAVFYGSEATVRSLAGIDGVNYLAFRLFDNSPAAQATTVAAIQHFLGAQTGRSPFIELPQTRASGTWPGQSNLSQILAIFDVITVLAVVCALFLIASTMNTLVVEQATEIAILKTLGGRRRQIRRIVLGTAAMIGSGAALVGTALGAGIAWLLTSYFAWSFFGVHAEFGVVLPVIVTSLLLGPILAMVASLPGLRRALRRPVAESLADRGATGFGSSSLDRLLARHRVFSGLSGVGVRNALRQKRRSAATIAQVAVAVGLALALLAVGRSVTIAVNQVYSGLHYDVSLQSNDGAPLIDARARSLVAGTPGVARVEPLVESGVQYRGTQYPAYGMSSSPLYRYRLSVGRWFDGTEASSGQPVVVLGPAIARSTQAKVGQTIDLTTAAGPARVRVIGIDTGQMDNGSVLYFPLSFLQHNAGMGGSSNLLWFTTTTSSHAAIDRITDAVQARLVRAGFPVQAQELYVEAAQNQSQNDAILSIIEILGLLVVAITLMGLVSALTMGVFERTREIGVLRCLGARARHVRRLFRAEAMALVVTGWAIGVLLGWVLMVLLLVFIQHDLGVQTPVVYPIASLPIALVALLAVTATVIRAPLRRATRIRPGSALRYQ